MLSDINNGWDINNLVEICVTKFYESTLHTSPSVTHVAKLIGKFCKAATPLETQSRCFAGRRKQSTLPKRRTKLKKKKLVMDKVKKNKIVSEFCKISQRVWRT